jgi:MFS family permease
MSAEISTPATEGAAATGWGAIVSGGRWPRFALVCVGVWLNAAETMMTATIMPSVAADIHGDAWFGWVVAIYLIGSILAGATSGRLAQTVGLKRALAVGGVTYALGCAAAAVAPTIAWFIAGRLLQGIGGGWVVGLCFVAITRLFPQSLWARVLSSMAFIWGVASLVSPLIGGLFAQAGFWRGAFWIFAIQGAAFVAASAFLIPAPTEPEEAPSGRIPFASLATLTAAIVAIGAAGLAASVAQSAILALAGCALLGCFIYLNARSDAPLIPRQAANPRSGTGAGLAMIFCMTAGTASITVFLPALMQRLYGASPLLAGYLLVSEAMAWSLAAFLVAGRPAAPVFIRTGGVLIVLGMVLFAVILPHGGLWLIPIATIIEGVGFGLCWSFTISRFVANAPEGEQAIASASAPTMQNIGTAVGSAASGVIAGLIGFGRGITVERATVGGFWLYAAFVPLTLLGAAAAWRLAAPRFNPSLPASDTIG